MQVVNVRDVDRMAREMQAVEHDIAKMENANAVLDDKGWELEAALVSKLEETEGLAEQCNQALKK
jgi:kinetochore protein NDC80